MRDETKMDVYMSGVTGTEYDAGMKQLMSNKEIIIRQGKDTNEDGIFDYLRGIFTGDIKRIQRYSHIEWSEPFQEEASKMTGFGDMIYEKGIQQGFQEGMILGALMSGKTPEEVSKMLNLPLEEIKKVQEQQMIVNK